MSDEILPPTLTAKERKRYEACKEAINTALEHRFKGGLALREVRDCRLYREDYASFDEFCQAAYSLGRRYVDYMIEAAEVKKDIEERSPAAGALLINESQARELANVPRGAQVKLLKELAKSGEPVTASSIKAKAESVLSETPDSIGRKASTIVLTGKNVPVEKSPIQVDEEGFPLTETAKRAWGYRDKVQGWLSTLSAIKSEIIALKDDPQFVRQQQQIIANLSSSYSTLSDCKAYAVCTECDGIPDTQAGKVCGMCGRTGAISKYAWGLQSRSSVKETRAKIAARQRV